MRAGKAVTLGGQRWRPVESVVAASGTDCSAADEYTAVQLSQLSQPCRRRPVHQLSDAGVRVRGLPAWDGLDVALGDGGDQIGVVSAALFGVAARELADGRSER